MKEFFAIFFGGGIGCILRYIISMTLPATNQVFPIPTFLCNIIGCLCIGIFYSLTIKHGWAQQTMLFLTSGICGGYTTFSTFSKESLKLLSSNNYYIAIIYILSSVLFGLLMVNVGLWLGNKL